ncbi:hypothetical protein EXU57_04325 [Segetibacter sp. 3557_3]|uniref:WbqC family protein n=1 Tax=Segetibacter sp. 3557_3 TaxID=2547429 RepID=UPI001058972E|nr:WbqC family protein [Segetibacter sp. 3557_3]TDH29296.1 hypothetical protein EXU57_04325 [Segetibacter sp. 3557_3]
MQLIDNQYLPCIYLIKTLINESYFVLEYCENFQKMSFRNRCCIAGSNNEIELSIPLRMGREQHTPIRQVEMDYSGGWNKQHWKSIQSAYARSPYFDYYGPQLKALLHSEVALLFDFNLVALNWVFGALKHDCEILLTSSYKPSYNGTSVIDNRNRWRPNNYRLVPDSELPRYTQVFSNKHGFRKNLSIIDLLFCEGPNAAAMLRD